MIFKVVRVIYTTLCLNPYLTLAQNDEINFFNIMSAYVCQISRGICLYSGNNVLTYSISKTSLYSEGLLSISPSFLVPTRAILILYKSRIPIPLR